MPSKVAGLELDISGNPDLIAVDVQVFRSRLCIIYNLFACKRFNYSFIAIILMFDVCHQSESELARLQSDPLTPNAESQVAPAAGPKDNIQYCNFKIEALTKLLFINVL